MLNKPTFTVDIALCCFAGGAPFSEGAFVFPFCVKRLVLFGPGLCEANWDTVTETDLARYIFHATWLRLQSDVAFDDLSWSPAISRPEVVLPARGGPPDYFVWDSKRVDLDRCKADEAEHRRQVRAMKVFKALHLSRG